MDRFLFIAVFLLITACSNNNASYNNALRISKENRVEIEKIIEHYRDDTIKLNAAMFLIENMIRKESIIFLNKQNKDSLLSYIKKLEDPYSWDPQYSILAKTIDSVLARYPQQYRKVFDLANIKSNTIIQNIDDAFEAWNTSKWHKNYTFSDFCNYVLPHKISNEDIGSWRSKATNDQMVSEDSIKENTSIYEFARRVADHSFIRYNIGMDYFFAPFGYEDIKRIGVGSCLHIAHMIIYNNRSRGVPCAIDMIPAWANRKGSHMWASVILPKNKSKGIYFNGEGENDFQNKVSKIYRKTYELQPQMSPKFWENVPQLFSNQDLIDVTDQYNMPTSTLVIHGVSSHNVNYIYLSTFNNKEWTPIAYAKRQEDEAIFKNIGRGLLPSDNNRMIKYIDEGHGIVYLPTICSYTGIHPASAPFILDTLGNIKHLVPHKTKENIRLFRKYPKNPELADSEKALVGGVVEAANQPDFSDSEIICVIEKVQEHPLESIKIQNRKKFKYVRFIPRHEVIVRIAELQFFDKQEQKISGVSVDKNTNNCGEKIFDGDLLTWQYKGENYTAHFTFCFDNESEIHEVRFSSRTDDNEVMQGEDYELFYWDNKWISLGRRVASNYFLNYEVPQNVLLLLKNHTKGVEERIFTIENGKQVWW